MSCGDRRTASEHANLAGELAGPQRGDRTLIAEAIAANDHDRAIDHEPRRGVPLANSEGDIAWLEASWRPAGKALR